MNLARLWGPSLSRRLVLLAAIWSVAVLLVTGVALTALFQREAVERFDEGLLDTMNGLYAGSSVDTDGSVDAPPLTDSRATRAYSGKYWQIAEPQDGKLHALVRSRSLWDSALSAPADGLGPIRDHPGQPYYYNTEGPAHEPLRAGAVLTQLPGRGTPVIFMAAEDRTPVDEAARGFAAVTAGALVVLGAGLVLAVFIQVRVGLSPLFALRREVAAVRTGKAERLDGDYPRELQPLAEELNALVANDQEVMERQRTHVGNLAHALKTPLSVMLTEAERQPGALAEVVTRQAETMRSQVDHHLRRARAAARSTGIRERTLLTPALEELSHALERIFRDREMEIDWRDDDEIVFQGERQDLMEIIGNVLENACKYGDDRVRVVASPNGPGRFLLVVDDNGPGLPPERRQEVLKRGARLDESAPGSGLGLSIVDDLARAYGGSVALADSPLGGLRVSVELPRADS